MNRLLAVVQARIPRARALEGVPGEHVARAAILVAGFMLAPSILMAAPASTAAAHRRWSTPPATPARAEWNRSFASRRSPASPGSRSCPRRGRPDTARSACAQRRRGRTPRRLPLPGPGRPRHLEGGVLRQERQQRDGPAPQSGSPRRPRSCSIDWPRKGWTAARVKAVTRKLDLRTVRLTASGEREDRGAASSSPSMLLHLLYTTTPDVGRAPS